MFLKQEKKIQKKNTLKLQMLMTNKQNICFEMYILYMGKLVPL